MTPTPIISGEQLLEHVNENLLIIDASGTVNAREQFEQEHLAGAIFLDLETDLSLLEKDPKNGGRHPLPDLEHFLKKITQLGLSKSKHIVIYDHFYGALAAARLWWMLTALGFEKVQVLSGGFQKAKDRMYPIESGAVNVHKVEALVQNPSSSEITWHLPTVARHTVEQEFQDDNHLLIDVRAPKRFSGIEEPIDPIAGHIPKAINLPFMENLSASGEFLSSTELHKKYASHFEKYNAENIAVYCGSGVTACHTLLALAHAGLPLPNLYVGSWGEWCRNL